MLELLNVWQKIKEKTFYRVRKSPEELEKEHHSEIERTALRLHEISNTSLYGGNAVDKIVLYRQALKEYLKVRRSK